LTLRAVVVRVSPVQVADAGAAARGGRSAEAHLAECVAAHPAAIGVRAVDGGRETAGLRCGACRMLYDLEVASFETLPR
jgi:hypothetical protein